MNLLRWVRLGEEGISWRGVLTKRQRAWDQLESVTLLELPSAYSAHDPKAQMLRLAFSSGRPLIIEVSPWNAWVERSEDLVAELDRRVGIERQHVDSRGPGIWLARMGLVLCVCIVLAYLAGLGSGVTIVALAVSLLATERLQRREELALPYFDR